MAPVAYCCDCVLQYNINKSSNLRCCFLGAGLVGSPVHCFRPHVGAQLRVRPAVPRRGERRRDLRGCGEQEDPAAGAAGGALAVSGAGCGESEDREREGAVCVDGVGLGYTRVFFFVADYCCVAR